MPVRERLPAVAAAALLVALTAVWWAGLYEEPSGGRLALIVLAASLPALATLAPRGTRAAVAGAAVVAVVGVGALASGRGVWELVGLSASAWADVLRLVPDGMEAANTASTPASAVDDAPFIALLDVALAVLAGAVSWAAVARGRGAAAVVVVGIGLAYRWTVEAPGSPVAAGVVALAVMLAALALVGGLHRRPRPGWAVRTAAAATVVLVVAAVLGAGRVEADRGWWQWRDWSVGGAGAVGSLDLDQNYGRLDWPETPRVVMRVRTPRPLPLRAAALAQFDGASFTAERRFGSVPLTVDRDRAEVEPVREGDPGPIEQQIRLEATETSLVMAGGRIVSVRGDIPDRVDLLDGGTVLVSPSIGPDAEYTAEVVVPDPEPRELLTARSYAPGEVPPGATDVRGGTGGATVTVPVWGTFDPQPTDASLGQYAAVRELARSVAGDAQSPYAAVNRVETYLRTRFTYDEAPPLPTAGRAPLVDFLFTTRRGFCQHFAGSMALMLRTLGVPSRVAVGYTAGRLDPDSGEWVVLDRDAHSWVEVLLPGEGWVAFDPTPVRYAPNRVSVGSPDYSPPPVGDPGADQVEPEPVQVPEDATPSPPAPAEPTPATPAPADPAAEPGATGDGGDDRAWWWIWTVLGVAAVAGALAVPLGRLHRRFIAPRRGSERDRVLAVVREFEADLRALGEAPPDTADADGRARDLRDRLGVDAGRLYRTAESARYGRSEPPAGTGRSAAAEARRLRGEIRPRVPRRRRATAVLLPRRDDRATLTR